MVKKLLTVLSDWLAFVFEDIFHIARSRTLYPCTSLVRKKAKIEFCLFLDVPYHHIGLVALLVYVHQVSCCRSSSWMVVMMYNMFLIRFILMYFLIIGLWPISFLCGFLLVCKYAMLCLMFKSRACSRVQSTRSSIYVADRSSSTISDETARLSLIQHNIRLWYHGIPKGLDGFAGNCTSF
jgi:hypothetical protein